MIRLEMIIQEEEDTISLTRQFSDDSPTGYEKKFAVELGGSIDSFLLRSGLEGGWITIPNEVTSDHYRTKNQK